MAKYKTKTPEERKKEIDNLTENFTEKIDSYFVSEDSFREHLQFMSKFYNYSFRNMALIDDQFRGANAVGSFNFWKSKGVHVKKGEKGIKILAPAPIEVFSRNNKQVQVRYATNEEKAKIRSGVIKTEKKMFFKIGHVFEYTQTNAREKGLEVSQLFKNYHRDGSIENDEEIYKSLENVADSIGVRILDEPKEELGTAKGASYTYLKEIALNPRNTPYEDITVLIHELAHAKLHTPENSDKLTTAEKEFQAEMVSYVVASRYGIDTEEFSLSYLAGWTKGKELKDKENLLQEVKDTSKEFIEIIDKSLAELEQAKENTITYKKDLIDPLEKIEEIKNEHNLMELAPNEVEMSLEINYPEDLSKYLSYKVLEEQETELQNAQIQTPLMLIHTEQGSNFEPFGESNNQSFDEIEGLIKYTVVIPKDHEELQVVSSFYESSEYAHPLHHMEKNNIVSEDDYNLLENNFFDHTIDEDTKYLKAIAPRIKAALEQEEQQTVKQEDLSIQI